MSQTTFLLPKNINAFWFEVKDCCDRMHLITIEQSISVLLEKPFQVNFNS